MWRWRRMEIKLAKKLSNEEVLERIGEKRIFLNNILRRKVNWVFHVLRRNCLPHDATEEHITEVKGARKRKKHSPMMIS